MPRIARVQAGTRSILGWRFGAKARYRSVIPAGFRPVLTIRLRPTGESGYCGSCEQRFARLDALSKGERRPFATT